MQTSNFWKRFVKIADSSDLEDVRRDTILEIAGVIFVVGWFMTASSLGWQIEYLPASVILLGGSLAGIWLRQINLRAASSCLIITLIGAIVCQKWLFPNSLVEYYFPVVVVACSLLVSNTSIFVVATIASAACLGMARLQNVPWFDNLRVVMPIILIYMTAFASWLTSRHIWMMLGWLQQSYNQVRHLLEQLRDERLSLERTLKSLEEAHIRIEKMNRALIEANKVAESARRLKAEFATNVSHELRTPLNIIIGFSETMANAPETYTDVTWTPTLRGDIEQIYESSRHLSSMIDDILDISALEMHRLGLSMEETDIQSVIEEAVAVAQDLFRAKKLYLNVHIAPNLPLLRIDPIRIRQVLINLFTNASRFTEVGGVTVTARLVGREIQVMVADTGIGIAPQDVPKVFEDFGQVDGATNRMHDGSGLGVPLSKRLVELHGGRMWMESQLRTGTTFYFTLPVLLSAHQHRQGQYSPDEQATDRTYRKTLLIAEPDPLLLRTARRHLGGYDVVEVKPWAKLPPLIEQHQPIALIIDRQGEDVTWLRDWMGQMPRDLPVIIISMPGNLHAAQALGIESFLLKPVLREQLLDAIANLDQPAHDVLVVGDDLQLVELISRMLQSAGDMYHPRKAFGGDEALTRLRQQHVDLVLLDMFMPDVNGLMVLREMKKDPLLAKIPVIAIGVEYPEAVESGHSLFINLIRPASASVTETLNCLQALVGVLPLRGLPAACTVEPESPVIPAGQPAS